MYRPLYWFGSAHSVTLDERKSPARRPVYSDHDRTVAISLEPYRWSDGEPLEARRLGTRDALSANGIRGRREDRILPSQTPTPAASGRHREDGVTGADVTRLLTRSDMSSLLARSRAVRARSTSLLADSGRLAERLRAVRTGRRSNHYAYLSAELAGLSVLALVRLDGSASGHVQWLQRATRLPAPLRAGLLATVDPMATVLSLARTCDHLTGLHLLRAGDRGVYPQSDAIASAGRARRPLEIDVDEWGDVHVVRLRGELDFATVPVMTEQLRSVTCSTLQLDLSALTFCDAVGLTALVSTKRRRSGEGCSVSIVGARGIVRRVFEVTGLEQALDD